MKFGDAEKILRDLEQQYDVKKTVKESMEFQAQDSIALFSKFADPKEFQDGSFDAVTRENATANLSDKDFQIITTVGSIRSNFIRLLKTEYPSDKHIKEIIDMIGDDIIIRTTTSKGKEGWLGQLIITSRRLADISTSQIKDGKNLFGLRK